MKLLSLPEWFSWRQNVLFSVAALGGSLGAYKFVMPASEPTIGIVIGAILGANIGSFFRKKRGTNIGFDELNNKIIDNSMLHGFIGLNIIIAIQIFSSLSYTSVEEIIFGSGIMIISLVVQALRFSKKLTEVEK